MSRGIQRGFLMLELIIALSVTAILSIYALGQLTRESEEALAKSAGSYLKTVAGAAEMHLLMNFVDYAAGNDVPGVAIDLRPTVAELVAMGRLNPGFPSGVGAIPTRQTARLDILRQNCPGPTCSLTALVCTTAPVTLGGAVTRFDLASTMVSEMNGIGGQSMWGTGGANIRGATLNVANPVGNVEGIVCASTLLDAGAYDRFVQIRDTRDPDLQGNLTVAGNTVFGDAAADTTTINGTTNAIGNVNVGPTANPCIRMQANGQMATNCLNPTDVPAGWAGGLRTTDVVAGDRMVAAVTPNNPTAGQYSMVDGGGVTGTASVVTTGRTQADRFTPSGSYAVGAACAEESAISRNSNGNGIVFCQSGAWRSLKDYGTANGACVANGSMATSSTGKELLCLNNVYRAMDTLLRTGSENAVCSSPGAQAMDPATGAALLCRANPQSPANYVYTQLRNVTTNLSFAISLEVSNGSVVTKPTCTGSGAATPIIQLIPKNMMSDDNAFAYYATNNGASWTVSIQSGAGGVWGTGSGAQSRAIAQVFCYYP